MKKKKPKKATGKVAELESLALRKNDSSLWTARQMLKDTLYRIDSGKERKKDKAILILGEVTATAIIWGLLTANVSDDEVIATLTRMIVMLTE